MTHITLFRLKPTELHIATKENGEELFEITQDQYLKLLEFNPENGEKTVGWEFNYEYFKSIVE